MLDESDAESVTVMGTGPSREAHTPPAPANETVRVVPSPVSNPDEYVYEEEWGRVRKVLRETEGVDGLEYKVQFGDSHTETVPFERLLELDGGSASLEQFNGNETSEDELNSTMKVKLNLTPHQDSDNEDEDIFPARKTRGRPGRGQSSGRFSARSTRQTRSNTRSENDRIEISSDDEDEESSDASSLGQSLRRSSRRKAKPSRSSSTRVTRQTYREAMPDDFEEEEESESSEDNGLFRLQSDVLPRKRRKRLLFSEPASKAPRVGTRRSDRATRHQQAMEEWEVDEEVYRDEEPKRTAAPKASGAREVFKELPRDDPFRKRHIPQCDTCGDGTTIGPLLHCQGCILSYHKACIGHRTGREHLVTKIAEDEFVLQCRRCVNAQIKKDSTAPDLAKCQVCKETGSACHPFRHRKTALQEQREREDNGGEDPVIHVESRLINNALNVLFRCVGCSRAFHFHHLPPKSPHHMDIVEDEEDTADRRFVEYWPTLKCKECSEMPAKVAGIVAWKPVDEENYIAGTSCENIHEDDKAYLIKWDKLSYFRAVWMTGAWTWGVTAHGMRKAFFNKETGPKMRTEDAIPEEFLRIDIVLDVKYTSIVDIRTEEIDKARIKEVDEALIKYKGLGYEDAVWEKVPTPEDGDRWTDFVTAYNDWVLGRYTHCPKKAPLQARLEKARARPFTELEKQKQPDNLQAGMELMKYQIDGLNWLYYQWYSKKNCILADEMGLGKTIQVIAFLATLIQDHTCFPFLVVVPNSTCPNWRREIKQWAPSLRVVTYFGSSQARNMAYQYEMFPENSKNLRCHVVVTSYDAAADDSCRRFFKNVSWAGLVVDEGQRLKSDKSILYGALNALKIPFRLLLTGTPLQNNTRELFNLLQFLDDDINAAQLEEEYEEMTKENIMKLHDLIRPYILRRTKAQVLTFLPPMGQIIVPLSMSVLQKKLYKSILAKNPDLLKALFSTERQLKPQERANLSNILMQLRKCLCHPFVYSQEIEERTDIAAISHRNLVEASAKLQFLELMLPKLKERGHRVLIFSQFLHMLDIVEDFLDGLEMGYKRLDGNIGSLEKQKRIDAFNAPNSPLFAFLLSTRAGGVGINLATADTVIILDPDFNPHQDIQALSRAHRIGQKKKVLCFQLMTKSSAEEKIVQIGRKKMALDHVVVESLDADDIEDRDVESVLRHGAAELFAEDNADRDIKYDNASIEKLLDRSQIENTKTGADASAETQFSFARVWANDTGALQDALPAVEDEVEAPPDPTIWEKILQERERAAAAEAAARQQALGRGKRARMLVDYNDRDLGPDAADEGTPTKQQGRRRRHNSESDTDFQADGSDEDESIPEENVAVDTNDLEDHSRRQGQVSGLAAPSKPSRPPGPRPTVKRFERVSEPQFPPGYPSHLPVPAGYTRRCPACQRSHMIGACPLKIAGPEHCNLCGLAHFGTGRICPHIGSETQVREMISALKQSSEPRHLVEGALKYLRGVKGHLVQKKKLAVQAQQHGVNGNAVASGAGPSTTQRFAHAPMAHGHGTAVLPTQFVLQPPVLPSIGYPPAAAPPGSAGPSNGAGVGNDDAAVAAALSGYLYTQQQQQQQQRGPAGSI